MHSWPRSRTQSVMQEIQWSNLLGSNQSRPMWRSRSMIKMMQPELKSRRLSTCCTLAPTKSPQTPLFMQSNMHMTFYQWVKTLTFLKSKKWCELFAILFWELLALAGSWWSMNLLTVISTRLDLTISSFACEHGWTPISSRMLASITLLLCKPNSQW